MDDRHESTRDSVPQRGGLELDPRLRLDALLERMLDLAHLGHEVGEVDELLRRVAARDDDVRARRPRA